MGRFNPNSQLDAEYRSRRNACLVGPLTALVAAAILPLIGDGPAAPASTDPMAMLIPAFSEIPRYAKGGLALAILVGCLHGAWNCLRFYLFTRNHYSE